MTGHFTSYETRTNHELTTHRRRNVDEPRLRQDTRLACVLPGTMWGAAAEQNCQVQSGAVLTLNSGRCPPGRRSARGLDYPSRQQQRLPPKPHPLSIMSPPGRMPQPRTGRRHTDTGSGVAERDNQQQLSGTVGMKSLGQLR